MTKVLFKGKRAIGIRVLHDNREYRSLYARKEVILSGGVIGSPHLLMLSGIGPRNHLESFKVIRVE